jgi:hypothetical protein
MTQDSKNIDAAAMTKPPSRSTHRLRVLLVILLVILTIQGWFGDTTNLFVTTSGSSSIPFSLNSIFQRIASNGPILIWHAYEGFLLLILSLVTIGLSFKWSGKRSVRITSILGALAIISAVIGGLTFLLSGFTAAGSSAQMGGSFIGAYAFYFMELYFTK